MSPHRAVRGAVYAEFLVAFVPFFLLFLAGIQLTLITQARIVVQHAASLAVRAAIVSIDDDPVFYEDGRRKVLSEEGKGKGSDKARTLVEGLARESAPAAQQGESSGSERLSRVRNAAYLPLSAIGPSHEQVLAWLGGALPGDTSQHSLEQTLGSAPLLRVLNNVALYTRVASAVTFPKAKGSDELRDPGEPWGDDETVRVRVTYLFPCTVPLVRTIACRSLLGMRFAGALAGLGSLFSDSERKEPFEQALHELERAEWADLQVALYGLHGEHFFALQGEAALPNQGAAYLYPSDLCKTKKRAPDVSCGGKR